jgi:hypothetical protein
MNIIGGATLLKGVVFRQPKTEKELCFLVCRLSLPEPFGCLRRLPVFWMGNMIAYKFNF